VGSAGGAVRARAAEGEQNMMNLYKDDPLVGDPNQWLIARQEWNLVKDADDLQRSAWAQLHAKFLMRRVGSLTDALIELLQAVLETHGDPTLLSDSERRNQPMHKRHVVGDHIEITAPRTVGLRPRIRRWDSRRTLDRQGDLLNDPVDPFETCHRCPPWPVCTSSCTAYVGLSST